MGVHGVPKTLKVNVIAGRALVLPWISEGYGLHDAFFITSLLHLRHGSSEKPYLPPSLRAGNEIRRRRCRYSESQPPRQISTRHPAASSIESKWTGWQLTVVRYTGSETRRRRMKCIWLFRVCNLLPEDNHLSSMSSF